MFQNRKKYKIIFIVIYFCIIVLISDFLLKKILNFKYNVASFCFDEITLYNYCPNSEHYIFLEFEDLKRKKIFTKINEYAIGYSEKFKDITPENANLIFIGDSFVQADELPMNEKIFLESLSI